LQIWSLKFHRNKSLLYSHIISIADPHIGLPVPHHTTLQLYRMLAPTALPALALLTVLQLESAEAHVALMEPPARNVLWRSGWNRLPKHKDDDYLICQVEGNKKCPPCGDAVGDRKPLAHQAGGKWAKSIIARNYTAGERITVKAEVTNSHGGYIEFKLCPHDNFKKPVTQRCLDRYPLEVRGKRNGRVPVTAEYGDTQDIDVEVILPKSITCDQCVIQMTQHTEQFKPSIVMFRNCADVAIHHKSRYNYDSREKSRSREKSNNRRSDFGFQDYYVGSSSSKSALAIKKPSRNPFLSAASRTSSSKQKSSLSYSPSALAQLSGANKKKLSSKRHKPSDDIFSRGYSSNRRSDSIYRLRSKSMFPFYGTENLGFALTGL